MSVRRRNVRERVARDFKRRMQSEELTLSLQQIQKAILAAHSRGETQVTDRFLREAFLAPGAPVPRFTTKLPKLAMDTVCDGCGFTFGNHIAVDDMGNDSVCPALRRGEGR
jgi:hypothetical protein